MLSLVQTAFLITLASRYETTFDNKYAAPNWCGVSGGTLGLNCAIPLEERQAASSPHNRIFGNGEDLNSAQSWKHAVQRHGSSATLTGGAITAPMNCPARRAGSSRFDTVSLNKFLWNWDFPCREITCKNLIHLSSSVHVHDTSRTRKEQRPEHHRLKLTIAFLLILPS